MLTFSGRLGCFFLLLGFALLAYFLVSDLAHAPQINELVAGVAVFLLGWMLWRKGRKSPRRSGRFRVLRGRAEDDE